MAKFSVAEIVNATEGKLFEGGRKVTKGVCHDSRKVKRGNLFIAIKGDNFDGNSFVKQAFKNGASVAIVSDSSVITKNSGKTMILVSDTTKALQDLAEFHRMRFKKLLVVGVTGSNGKTTVKDLTFAVLSKKYKTLKTEGNLNNHIGVPLTIFKLSEKHEAAVIEMGMNHSGEIALLTKIVMPKIGVITNVSSAHIGNFASIAGIRKAKKELIDNLPKNGIAILNADDKKSVKLIKTSPVKTITFGKNSTATVNLVDTWPNSGMGRWADIYFNGKAQDVHIRLIGEQNLQNAMAAFAVGLAAKVHPEDIAKGIDSVKPSGMRMEPFKLSNGAILINDAYNANPESVKAALNHLGSIKKDGRAIAVLGDMLELGKKGETAHADVGAYTAKAGIKKLFTLGKLSKFTKREARKRGVLTSSFNSHEKIADALLKTIGKGDVVLVKGSRGMKMEKIADRLVKKIGGRK